jgi:hypothetical protein
MAERKLKKLAGRKITDSKRAVALGRGMEWYH